MKLNLLPCSNNACSARTPPTTQKQMDWSASVGWGGRGRGIRVVYSDGKPMSYHTVHHTGVLFMLFCPRVNREENQVLCLRICLFING